MFRSVGKLVAVIALVQSVTGHAAVKSPAPRKTGPAHEQLCGAPVVDVLENDITGPIENAVAKADSSYKCNAYLCRGYQFEDNEDNVRSVKAGDVIDFEINLVAGHRPGFANVSVVDLASNKVIGKPLLTWPSWPCNSQNPCEDVEFNVTIPDSLGSQCDEGGKCALQWYWLANSKQTYESCIDFKIVA